MTKSQAGRLGGLSTVRKYGRSYMSMIGKRGAKAFHQRYKIAPAGTSYYLIVEKETGKIINSLGGLILQ